MDWSGGAQGYMNFLAQEERNFFSKLLTLAQHQQENVRSDATEGLQMPTLEELRAEWVRRGLRAVDFDKMRTVTGIQAKQRIKLIEHDPKEQMRVRNGRTKQQGSKATSTTDPESEQWWEDEEEDEAEG